MSNTKTDLILVAIASAKSHVKALLIELVNIDACSAVVSDVSSAIEYLDVAVADARRQNEPLLPMAEVRSVLSESQTLEIVQTVKHEIHCSMHGIIQAVNKIVDEKYAGQPKQQVSSGVPDTEWLKGVE